MKDEALKLALEALEYWDVHGKLHQPTEEAITAIKDALAQPAPTVQKPVAWMYEGEYSSGSYSGNYFEWRVTMNKNATNAARKVKPLYTTPPAAQQRIDRVRELECVIADLKAECKGLRAAQRQWVVAV
jgi:hypothetical protein